MKVAVILEHTCVKNCGHSLAVELIKVSTGLKRLGDLDGTVTSEVIEDNAVAVLYGTYGLAVLCDNEGRKILVDDLGLCSVGVDSLLSGCKLSALAENVGLPACFNHSPVSLVSVHGDLHSAAAGCDSDIEGIVAKVCDERFKGENVIKRGSLANVTAVEKDVDTNTLNAVLLRVSDESLKVVDV